MSGLEVLGGISACEGLLKDIIVIVHKYVDASDDIKRLSTYLKDTEVTLKRLLPLFSTQTGLLSDVERNDYTDTFKYLEELLGKTKRKASRYVQHRFIDRVDWVMRGNSLVECEKELQGWSQRLTLQLILLSVVTKSQLTLETSTSKSTGTDDGSVIAIVREQARMQSLAEKFRATSVLSADRRDELELASRRVELLSNSSAALGKLWAIVDGSLKIIVDMIRVPASLSHSVDGKNAVREEVMKLAAVLDAVQPAQMHILQAMGFYAVEDTPQPCFGLAYQFPPRYVGCQILLNVIRGSERDVLDLPRPRHKLEDRVRIAQHIVTGVLYVHSVGWVHKSIRSDNVILGWNMNEHEVEKKPLNPTSLGTAFLTGFSYSRRDEGESTGSESLDWKDALYVHPERVSGELDLNSMSHRERVRYSFIHDFYSVGVVLLEVGLWKPLRSQGKELANATPEGRRDWLVKQAKDRLPVLLGSRYAKVTQKCLEGTLADGMEEVLDELMLIKLSV